MTTDIRITADEAKRLSKDTAFLTFCDMVRKDQMEVFANSGAEDVSAREQAYSVIRALKLIQSQLDAAMTAERMLDRKLERLTT